MTLEQLLSPVMSDWFKQVNERLNESNGENNLEQIDEEFNNFYTTHINEINESLRAEAKKVKKVNEGRFSKLKKIKRAEATGEEIPVEEPISGRVEEDPTTGEKIEDEVDIEKEEEELGISLDPKSRVAVSNAKEGKLNVFNAVNKIYNKICKDNANAETVTPLRYLDTSEVVDMTALLAFTNLPNADLSTWSTRMVTTMEGCFYKSTFNNDSICGWKVDHCTNFKNMFRESKFKQSLKMWKTGIDSKTGLRVPLPYVGAAKDEEDAMMQDFWDKKFADFSYGKKSEETVAESKSMNHVLDFESFMMNEGRFGDFIKSGIEKVKSFFKSAAVKVNDFFVAVLGEGGEVLPVVTPATTINYLSNGNVEGVSVYSAQDNEIINGVSDHAQPIASEEVYDNVDEESNEYKNYLKFLEMMSEEGIKENFININYDDIIEEDRVGLSGESGGVFSAQDINTKKLKKEIEKQMLFTEKNVGRDVLPPILIWGAPGIGKSTIPNAIIEAYNELQDDVRKKKSLIVAECGEMTADGFSLPLPLRQDFENMASNRPNAKKISDELGLKKEDWAGITFDQSGDAPKIWLPCYKPNADKRKNEALKALANGNVVEYYDKDGNYQVTETCDGGLIMFDEFMRAEPQIFNIVMQILLNRAYQGYRLGDAWGMIACSNRPNDDSAIDRAMKKISPVAMNRFRTQYNFVPDFNEWKTWATTKGGFDEVTLAFLTDQKGEHGEYTNWHSVDPDKNAEGHSAHATPRSWSVLMKSLKAEMKFSGYSSILDIPEDELEDDVCGAVGTEVGMRYIDWLKRFRDGVSINDIFNTSGYTPKGEIPACPDMCNRLLTYAKAHWSKTELPEEKLLLNMTIWLKKNYSKGKDHYVLQFHEDLIKYLDIATMLGDEDDKEDNPDNWNKYAKYSELIDKYYPEV